MTDIVPYSAELVPYSFDAQLMGVEPIKRSANYNLIPTPGAAPVKLERDTDFGVIPGTKKPSLYKSGAEKVCMSLGLCQHYTIESRIEQPENGFFYFSIRCDLVKIVDGREYVIVSSYGSANTREKRCGGQSAFDGANSALKMAQKRALVGAAICLGGLSSLFSQDMENEDYTGAASAMYGGKDPNAPIDATKVKYFYSIATRHGVTKSEAKELLSRYKIKSAKEITCGIFDELCEQLRVYHETEVTA